MTYSTKSILRIFLPIALAAAILYGMYRDFDWSDFTHALTDEMAWGWMLLSFPFGILAQVFRATRWQQLLEPLGEKPRLHTSICAIFLSYASSLVVPRVGEVLRCGVLKRSDDVSFSHGIGTVVTERIVDMLCIVGITALTVALQADVFLTFFQRTGMSLQGALKGFNVMGYCIAGGVALLLVVLGIVVCKRLQLMQRVRSMLGEMRAGLFSIRRVRKPWLFLFYSLAIWACYYLHFYLALLCFPATASVGAAAALVAFVVGTFAVLVPTPNGAGPWHFAIMTALALYGVSQTDGATCALVTHTIQTMLVLILGIYALVAMALTNDNKTKTKKI